MQLRVDLPLGDGLDAFQLPALTEAAGTATASVPRCLRMTGKLREHRRFDLV